MNGLTQTQLAILEALATYRLCTAAQLHAIGVTKHLRHVHTVLGELHPGKCDPPPEERVRRNNLLIGCLHFGNVTGRGSRADVWHLTRTGAKRLALERGDPEPIKVPDRIEPYHSEYEHRRDCIDAHIGLRRFAEANGVQVDFVHTFFGRGDERYRTRVTYAKEKREARLTPDMIFHLTDARGTGRLYAFELYRAVRTELVTEKLLAYLDVLGQEAIEKAFGYGEYAAQVLVAFDTEAGERHVRERLSTRDEFLPFAELFFFKTLEEVQADFRSGWRRVGSTRNVPLFGTDPLQ
jgi:hypothetical protein